jgi:hypothetical protein
MGYKDQHRHDLAVDPHVHRSTSLGSAIRSVEVGGGNFDPVYDQAVFLR